MTTSTSNIESLILRRFAVAGQVAVEKETGIDNTMLSRFLHGERGLRLDQIGPVLTALGLMVIECDGAVVTMPARRANALMYLAAEALANAEDLAK